MSVTVRDSGTGIGADIVASVFALFFATRPLGPGTGLGLSMVHGFIRRSGVDVQSPARWNG